MSEANGAQSYADLEYQVRSQELQIMQSALASRARFAHLHGLAFGGERDYYAVLGYDRYLTPEKYYAKFRREGIASRIVSAYPDETWRLHPKVYEDDTDNETAFEAMWNTMQRKLRVFHYMHRADIQACLGRFAIMFLSFNDAMTAESLALPVSPGQGRSIVNISTFGEINVEVAEIDTQFGSPRQGLPLYYEIDFDRSDSKDRGSSDLIKKIGKKKVHWQRVIHLADDLLDDDIYGKPKLEGCYNYLEDLMKIIGGGGEAFWRNAKKDLIAEVDKDANFRDGERERLTERMDEYTHGFRPALVLEGMSGKSLPIEVADPKAQFDATIQLISGTTGIPKRILLGSEQGELASSQDAVNWAQKNMTRQSEYADPTIIRAFINRCILTGVLPTPMGGPEEFTVEWEPLLTEDEGQKADTLQKRTQAISTYANGAASVLVPFKEYREEFLGLDPVSPYESEESVDSADSAHDDIVDDNANA